MSPKRIPLSQGKFAIVDNEDYERVNQFKWSFDGRKYAVRGTYLSGRRSTQAMHRFILNAPADLHVDHINGNGLDNRRINIRLATPAQNLRNNGPKTNSRSKHKGICWHKKAGKWLATIKKGDRKLSIGLFESEEVAAAAYNVAARQLFGEFAHLNDVPDNLLPDDFSIEPKPLTSSYRGVHWSDQKRAWVSQVNVDGKRTYLGRFDDETEAARIRDQFAKEHNLKVKFNFPD